MRSKHALRTRKPHPHQPRPRPTFVMLIGAKTNYHCWYCGDKLTRDTQTIDHLTPVILGGRTTYSNCVLACFSCNNAKDKKTVDAFRHMVGVKRFYGEPDEETTPQCG